MKKFKKEIKYLVVHTSATEEGKDFKVKDIRQWHKARGWSDIGYHFVIDLDGTIETGRPIEYIGAQCKGHNYHSLGICLIGGLKNGKSADTITLEQDASLVCLLSGLKLNYPNASIVPHNRLNSTQCPGFDVDKFLEDNGL